MSASLDGKSNSTEEKLIVGIGKSEAEVTNDKRLRSRNRNVEAKYRHTQSIMRPLCDS